MDEPDLGEPGAAQAARCRQGAGALDHLDHRDGDVGRVSRECREDPGALDADDDRRALFYDEEVPSVGAPLDGCEVSVRGTWGERRGEHERGELCVRGPSRMLGYWEDVSATERTLYGDWLRTGDEARMDVQGYVHFSARVDDVITSSGYRIGP